MATAIIYSLPPAALYYAVRKYMVSGRDRGGDQGLAGTARPGCSERARHAAAFRRSPTPTGSRRVDGTWRSTKRYGDLE